MMTKTDHTIQGTPDPATAFYDAIAPEYDRMTGFEQRFIKEKPFFHLLVNRHHITTALDAGCGTGFHSLLLAKLGVEVTAIDSSEEMLARLTHHAKEMKLKINVQQSTFQRLSETVHTPVDAVFCLGNSLVHLLTPQELERTLYNFHAVLQPDGMLFIQLLNYHHILEQREAIQSIKEIDTTTYIRYYEFSTPHPTFNLLTIRRDGGPLSYTLHSTPHRPLEQRELMAVLSGIGFTSFQTYGNMSLEPFKQERSQNLIILAKK